MPTWDERKRRSNIRCHGLDFADAEPIWDDITVTREDIRESYDERRWVTFGILHGEIVVLVYAEGADDDQCISLRRAESYEITYYVEAAKKRRR
jgi:uncharacterized protein